MMRPILLLCFFSMLASCNPEREQYALRYKVIRTSQEPVTYRAIFTVPGNATKQVGPIDTWWWESDVVPNVSEGSTAQLKLEIISGEGSFELTIFRNGGEWGMGETTLDAGESELIQTEI